MKLLGDHPSMVRLRERVDRVASTPLPILVHGETGTGKEVVARRLHALSGRTGPFVPVDCGALSPSLVESELFGHEKGAFTGATSRREGLVWAARGGTFFLDEIGELPLAAQTRLLRLLENGTYRPVGGHDQQTADLRVVAATWRDLRARVAEGAFREDLFHRLATVELILPPLRDRGEDVLALFQTFVEASLPDGRDRIPVLDPVARAWLLGWPWPGNVREVRNAARYVAAMVPGDRITLDDLPPQLRREAPTVADGPMDPSGAAVRVDLPYMEARRRLLDDFQLRYVQAQLEACEGNVSAAARAAGMDRRTIQRILAQERPPTVDPD